jgi:predicted ester cyclase
VAAVGKSFAIGTMNIFRVRDGKIADSWTQFDTFDLLQQLGVIPAQG